MRSGAVSATVLACTLFVLACRQSNPPVSADPTPTTDALALVHAVLIDGTGTEPIADATLLIEDGLVRAAGPHAKVDVPRGTRTVDLSGCTMLPGFINTHVHSGYDASNLEVWARAGVTTIRDLGADPRLPLFSIRDSLGADPACARVVAAGPMVTVPGGYPGVPWGSPIGLAVTSPDDARQKISRLLDDGADVIKIAVESGGSFGRIIPTLSLAETAAIVGVAHGRGTRVSAHVLVSEDLAYALDGGVDDIAHMVTDSLSDELVARMVHDDVYWVPTLELWMGVGHGRGDAAVANLERFVRAGGKVALGTDYDGYNSRFDLGMPIREIRWMQDAGMTPMQIIVAATRNAAAVCNMDDELGTLEPGKIADVLVVKGNPLQNLDALQAVRMVVRGGVIIRDD